MWALFPRRHQPGSQMSLDRQQALGSAPSPPEALDFFWRSGGWVRWAGSAPGSPLLTTQWFWY